MALTPGTRLGVYEVAAQIGEGGMGQVYRATDTRLKRPVAIKILPPSVAADADRLARFQREAEVLASVSHPNIAAIYGLEENGGLTALVMELVEGEDLAQRIARGAIPIDEALPIAKQIAEALEAAHEQGIIHRDLKPANIKVRRDGTVKVLDFGLAKAMVPAAGSSPSVSQSPTLTTPATTQAGMILGTAAYMSPEQARGMSVDKRADLWAFGAVVWEMLTGKRLFEGVTVSDTLASVLKTDPDWGALAPTTPSAIRRLLRRCLEKDRKRRLSDAADARLEIDEALAPPSVADPMQLVTSATRRKRSAWIAAVVAGGLLVVAAGLGLVAFLGERTRVPDAGLRTGLTITQASGAPLALRATYIDATASTLALSPDGTRLALEAGIDTGKWSLWVRRLDSMTTQPVPGTDKASSPFWSPDGRVLGFFTVKGDLMKVAVDGGSPTLISTGAPSVERRSHGTWSQRGDIVFDDGAGTMFRVPASGGTPVKIGPGRSPSFLPDGSHFLYRATTTARTGAQIPVEVRALDGTEGSPVGVDSGADPKLSQGHLLFWRGGTILAQPFDMSSLKVTGEPVTVAEQVDGYSNTGGRPFSGAFTATATGAIVFQPAMIAASNQLTWIDRRGTRLTSLGDAGAYNNVELAPDGRHASLAVLDPMKGTHDIWTVDVAQSAWSRFTFESTDERSAVWTPDGARLIFNVGGNGRYDLFAKAASGAGATEEVLKGGPQSKDVMDVSRDGRYLLFRGSGDPKTGNDIWVLPLFGDRKPYAFLQTGASENFARFSPDGRLVAYTSDESGQPEIYVAPFQGTGKWQVSASGGRNPGWRGDGRELYFLALDGYMMAATVSAAGDAFKVEEVRRLFQVRASAFTPFAVTPDGQRFLVVVDTTAPPPPTLILNWPAALKAK